MIQVTFRFYLMQAVHIHPIGTDGIVTAMIVEEGGKMYRVAYWDDGIRKTEWLLAGELVAKAEKKKTLINLSNDIMTKE